MRRAWTEFSGKKGEKVKEKHEKNKTEWCPALPTRLVFQKEPDDTLRC